MEFFSENSIHVTGFGVFRGFTSSNPSWEAVKQLTDHIIHNGQTIPIVKHEVSVTYEAVDKKIHEIWSKKPKVNAFFFAIQSKSFLVFFLSKSILNISCFQLVVHCGVNHITDKICLERSAFNGKFDQADFTNQFLSCCNVTLPNSGAECKQLDTSLNVDGIINDIDVNTTMMKCSDNPGE